jgi:hypothetical protein
VAEAGIDDIKAVEVVELPNFVFSPVSDKMRNTEKREQQWRLWAHRR